MENVFFRNNQITTAKTKDEDLGFVLEVEYEPENARYITKWSESQHLEALNQKDILHLILKDSKTSLPIGYMIIAGLENPYHNIELRRIVIQRKGCGLGRKTLRVVKEIAFNKLKAHRLWLDVVYTNYRAQNLYRSEGFVEDGTLREATCYNGEYEDLIIMSILENEYQNRG